MQQDTTNENTIIKTVEQDAREIESNYGHELTVEEQNGEALPQLHLHIARENEIADEIISVIVNKGYEASYVRFNEQTVAFTPENQADDLPKEMDAAIDTCLSEYDLVKNGNFEVYPLSSGYEVHIEVIGNLSYDAITQPQSPLLYITDDIEVVFRGFQNSMLVLTVEHI